MPGLTFPVTSGELILTVVVGHNRDALEKRVASGQPLPSPVLARAVIDTGTNVTCVSRAVLHQLGIAKTGRGKTQTASAQESANLFGVSLSITPVGNLPGPTLTISGFVVMELPGQIPGIEVSLAWTFSWIASCCWTDLPGSLHSSSVGLLVLGGSRGSSGGFTFRRRHLTP